MNLKRLLNKGSSPGVNLVHVVANERKARLVVQLGYDLKEGLSYEEVCEVSIVIEVVPVVFVKR